MREVHLLVGLFVVCTVGCAGGSPEPATTTTPTTPQPVAPTLSAIGNPVSTDPAGPALATCVTKVAGNDVLDTDTIAITGTRASMCFESASRTCWSFDLATNTFTPAAVTSKPADDAPKFPRPHATAALDDPSGSSIRLCPMDGSQCRSFRAPVKLPEDAAVATNADTSLVALTMTPKNVSIYETATGKKRGVVRPWTTPMSNLLQDPATFVTSQRVIIWESVTPVSSGGKLFDVDGKFLANIGNAHFTQQPYDSWPLDAATWMFKAFDSDQLIVVDVTTGKQLVAYHLGALWKGNADEWVATVPLLAAAGDDKRIVGVAYGMPMVVTIDRATGAVTGFAPPACSPDRK